MPFKLSTISAALTSVSRSAASTITVPGAKGANYTLTKVRVTAFGTLTTVVNVGAKVEVENDSLDYKPFEFITNYQTMVTSGGVPIKPTNIKCNQPLPAGSILSFYFTPFSTASTKFAVTIEYEKRAFSGRPLRMQVATGSAVTATTKASDHLTWTIPSGKGGRAISLILLALGTLETVVDSGGLVSLHTLSPGNTPWSPLDFYIGGATVGSCGGTIVEPQEEMLDGFDVEGQGIIYADYTPQDNQSQLLIGSLVWEG